MEFAGAVLILLVAAGALGLQDAVLASPDRFGDGTPGTVYVRSQGVYYDTFVVQDPLPMRGRFQADRGW